MLPAIGLYVPAEQLVHEVAPDAPQAPGAQTTGIALLADIILKLAGLLIAMKTPTGPKTVPVPTTTLISESVTMLHAAEVPDDGFDGVVPIFAVHVCDAGMKFDPATVMVEPTKLSEEGLTLLKVGLEAIVNAALPVTATSF